MTRDVLAKITSRAFEVFLRNGERRPNLAWDVMGWESYLLERALE
jgi:hypothetical protein